MSQSNKSIKSAVSIGAGSVVGEGESAQFVSFECSLADFHSGLYQLRSQQNTPQKTMSKRDKGTLKVQCAA